MLVETKTVGDSELEEILGYCLLRRFHPIEGFSRWAEAAEVSLGQSHEHDHVRWS